MTKSQRMLWTGQQLEPEAPLYNMAMLFFPDLELDEDRFEAAFRRLVRESDALSTLFLDEAHQGTLGDFPFERLRLDSEEEAREWARVRARRRLRLDEQAFDTALIRLANGSSAWYLNQHHLITDIASCALVVGEVAARYHDPGGVFPLPRFADYRDEVRLPDSVVAYWSRKTAAAPPLPRFYGRRLREPGSVTRRNRLVLSREASERLARLAAEPPLRSLTPHLSLFNLFGALLFGYVARVTGQSRLVMGAPCHNRVTPELRRTIGLLMETFPLTVEVEPGDTLRTLAGKVGREHAACLRHAHPGASAPSHFRTWNFLLNYIPTRLPQFAGVTPRVDWVHPDHGDPRQVLRLQVYDLEGQGRFTLDLDLNEKVFAGDQSLPASHLLRLLEAALEDPDRPLADVVLAGPEEVRALTAGEKPAASEGTVLEEWATKVQRDGPCLRLGDRHWTYAEVDASARRLAGTLASRGVGRGTRVAILARRSSELVTAVLGVLMAGGAYVPLDPAYPAERNRFILEDSGACLLLLGPGLEAPGEVPTLRLDDPPADAPAPAPPEPHDAAYVLYTSGSTGQPKGVVVSHRALYHYLTWARAFYLEDRPATMPLFSPFAFDLTVTSLFLPLLSGGTLVVYPESEGPVDLAVTRVVEDDAVDVLKLTPSHLALVLDRLEATSRLRTVILGGEELTVARARALHRAGGGRLRIVNEYGPTEATVGCIVHRYDPDQDRQGAVPIGSPIPGMRAYVLGPAQEPLPAGLEGELYLAGASLAEGYHGRPELTRERFLPDPFHPGQRMYRTGDLARRRADGTFEFLGRLDEQVKVHGARVELGEVEAVLRSAPGVEECVVSLVTRSEADETDLFFCARCGLASNYPEARFDEEGVCSLCREFESYRSRAEAYFQTMDDLAALLRQARGQGRYDCLVLLSGGKDSCYALYRLVEMNIRILAFTLDNGFISEQAKANISRVVEALGVDHVFATTPAMNEIFRDSLRRHCNVCNGCFKTIYTLSLKLAREEGIPFIVTGLSRGQLFETRLTKELFTEDQDVDAVVLEARKAYHRFEDAVTRHLNTEEFYADELFERVRFVDFYRYCDVGLDEVLETLRRRLPWLRPDDTGRSTNCLINDLGIYVHKKERGYHNYALPYSWDVRLGHKSRDQALEELRDRLDRAALQRMLNEVGYDEVTTRSVDERLTAYYVAPAALPSDELRAWLRRRLPDFMVPSFFVRLEALPLSPNGKVDRRALPAPRAAAAARADYLPPANPTEEVLAALWAEVLRLPRVGRHDNFFDLGGDSIRALQIVSRANARGLRLAAGDLFEEQTVAALAAVARSSLVEAEQGPVTGGLPPAPIHHWFFAKRLPDPNRWCHVVRLRVDPPVEPGRLKQWLERLAAHHDALRLRFQDGRACHGEHLDSSFFRVGGHLEPVDLGQSLVQAVASEAGDELTLSAHHLVVDGLSWRILVEDLERLSRDEDLPPKTSSFRAWTAAMAGRDRAATFWAEQARLEVAELPVDRPGAGCGTEASREEVRVGLSAEETGVLVRRLPSVHRCEVQELLLSCLVGAVVRWTGRETVAVDLEGDGRNPAVGNLDFSRTVGWFTALYPMVFRWAATGGVADLKAQLRRLPDAGRGYGLLRYLDGCRDLRPSSELLFNYLGGLGRTEPGARFSRSGPLELVRDPEGERSHLLEVHALVHDDALEVVFGYSRDRHDRATVETLAGWFLDELRRLLDAAHRPAFPLARLDEEKLAKIAGMLKS